MLHGVSRLSVDLQTKVHQARLIDDAQPRECTMFHCDIYRHSQHTSRPLRILDGPMVYPANAIDPHLRGDWVPLDQVRQNFSDFSSGQILYLPLSLSLSLSPLLSFSLSIYLSSSFILFFVSFPFNLTKKWVCILDVFVRSCLGKDYHMQATSKQDMDDWLVEINKAMVRRVRDHCRYIFLLGKQHWWLLSLTPDDVFWVGHFGPMQLAWPEEAHESFLEFILWINLKKKAFTQAEVACRFTAAAAGHLCVDACFWRELISVSNGALRDRKFPWV